MAGCRIGHPRTPPRAGPPIHEQESRSPLHTIPLKRYLFHSNDHIFPSYPPPHLISAHKFTHSHPETHPLLFIRYHNHRGYYKKFNQWLVFPPCFGPSSPFRIQPVVYGSSSICLYIVPHLLCDSGRGLLQECLNKHLKFRRIGWL